MKKQSRKTIAILFIAVTIFIAAATGVAVLLIKLSDLDARKGDIISALSKKLKREVSYDRGDFSLYLLGPTFTFTGIKINEKDSRETFATIERITFRLAVLPLLWKRIVLKEVLLERPVGMLHRDHDGIFNISDLLEREDAPQAIEIERITVNRGAVTFTDQGIIPSGLTTSLDDINLRIDRPGREESVDLDISLSIIQEGNTGTLSVAGQFMPSGKDEPFTNSSVDARIVAANLSIERYRPYYEKHLPFRKMTGILNMDTRLKGNPNAFSSEGSVKLKNLNLQYPGVFHSAIAPKDVSLNYTLRRGPSEIIMDTLDLTVDGVKISSNCTIKDIDKDDPLITAKASSSPIPLEKLGHFIPYGIMPRSVANFIETHIKGGIYELKEGSLNGRISQIAHMGKNDNYNVLYVKVGVDKGLLTYGRETPVFSSIKGELELRGRDFLLHNMSGNFGESPMTLEGRITDYCLATPKKYPFSMTMKPGQKEITWLLGSKGDKLAFAGETILQMTGSGSLNNYTLDGHWDLSGAAYSYSDIFTKPQPQSNRLALKANFKNDKVRLESLSYQLASLAISGTGIYDIKNKHLSYFSINANPFQIEDLSANLPRIRKYEPRGRIQLSLTGDGMPKSIADLRLRGNIQFSDISFKTTQTAKDVSNFSGTISFTENGLETSPLVGRLGHSLVRGSVSLTDFKNPAISMNIYSAFLDLEDLGLQSPPGAIKLRDFAGKFIYNDGGLQIKSLSISVNKSVLDVTGAMPDVKKPFFDIHISSPYLDTDDIIILSKISYPEKEESTSEGFSLKASVRSDKGKINQIPYSKLRTTFTYRQHTLDIPALEMNAFDGSFSSSSRYVFAPGGITRYQGRFAINKMSAEQIMKYANSERLWITGAVTMHGNMSAEGTTLSDLKKTTQGTITLKMEKGSLKKFVFLSKVFSILNVSQLLKFQLPDIINDGMPYNTITGSFSIKDGILSTNDLSVDSDSMNMSIVGTSDLVREDIDLIIGVRPLQTADKVVSRIPVAGWILTSDTKGLISLYFQAKGNRDNPAVNAIPVNSMTKGVLSVFKKLLQLPEKLITDTGEVIMGQ